MQILTRMLRLQMTENSPEPRGIRKAKKATRKYSSESNSNISPLLLFHNSIAFCILKRSPSPLKRICQVTIKLIIIYIPGVSAANRKITHWQNGFRLLYFKGMIYRQKTTEAIMKSKNNFWILQKKTKWLENLVQQSLVFFPQLLHYYRKSKLFLCFSLFLGANVTGYKMNLSIMICVLKHLKLIFIEITFL